MLYVSHNMATIRDLCDRCIVLDKGKVVFDGGVDEGIALYLSTKSQETAFIDYSKVKRDNWFKRDNIRLQSVELIDTDNEVLERRKPVQVRYRVYAKEAASDVGLRLEMRRESVGGYLCVWAGSAAGVYKLCGTVRFDGAGTRQIRQLFYCNYTGRRWCPYGGGLGSRYDVPYGGYLDGGRDRVECCSMGAY